MFTCRTFRVAQIMLLAATLALVPAPATAQNGSSASEELSNCRSNWQGERSHYCELRTLTVPLSGGALSVDGRQNGGISVRGADVSNVTVEALVQGWADNERDAEYIAKQVRISTGGGRISADAPSSDGSGWSVSYRISVPRHCSLDLHAHNGGISVRDVTGKLQLDTHNGGIRLADVGGDVRGETTNGGVRVDLTGDHYEGSGMDVTTTNGGIVIVVPPTYSARLEAGTVNGGLSTDIPSLAHGRNAGRTLSTTLGRGGALVHVATHNGGVHIRRGAGSASN